MRALAEQTLDDGYPFPREHRWWADQAERHARDLIALLDALGDSNWCEDRMEKLTVALQFYADLGPDEVPYADTINDPPDVGRVAREALADSNWCKRL